MCGNGCVNSKSTQGAQGRLLSPGYYAGTGAEGPLRGSRSLAGRLVRGRNGIR